MVNFDAPFVAGDNLQPRCACVLVLDHSGSMEGEKISKLNEALSNFPKQIMADKLVERRVEIAAVGFPPPRVLQPFCRASEFAPPVLQPGGTTPLGAAVRLGYHLIEERKIYYKATRLDYFRPVLITVTDGAPDANDDWSSVAEHIRAEEERLRVSSFAVGVGEADRDVLRAFTRRPVAHLVEFNFAGMFAWLASTLKAVSGSQSHTGADPSQKVPLPKPPPETFDWDTN